ncbi:MAG: hypothetical protein J6X28_02400 [Bacilli bacterium]|nr:hypothetical protein [Bacilli bacterium]
MSTRKSMKLPVVITFLFICIIVYLFMNIKQTVVVCEKVTTYDADIKLTETVVSNMDGKKITSLSVTKKITVPEKYSRQQEALNGIKNSMDYTTAYLGNKASCIISGNSVVVDIDISNNELVLLDNVSFYDNDGEIGIHIDTNTKSSEVITLQVGDAYTDGELMMYLKNHGYSCK